MTKIIKDYATLLKKEHSKDYSFKLRMNRDESETWEAFVGFVAAAIKECEGREVEINQNDLVRQLVFNAIQSERDFIKKDLPPPPNKPATSKKKREKSEEVSN